MGYCKSIEIVHSQATQASLSCLCTDSYPCVRVLKGYMARLNCPTVLHVRSRSADHLLIHSLVVYVLYFFCHGGAVVYPSASFDPAKLARALVTESCTHTCLVPTALHSLLDHIQHDGTKFSSLVDVCLAGASITPQHIRQVIKVLGSQGVSTGFGMTEGSPIWTAAAPDPETLISDDITVSGKASPGTRIRICAPDSAEPVRRGEPGEVHESGPGVISGYLGSNVDIESFYVDGEGRR